MFSKRLMFYLEREIENDSWVNRKLFTVRLSYIDKTQRRNITPN
jgi:hypothetical protein